MTLKLLFLVFISLISCLQGSPSDAKAFWIEDTVIGHPDPATQGITFELVYNLTGVVQPPSRSGSGIPALYERTLTKDTYSKFPNLATYLGLRLQTSDINLIKSILKGDFAIVDFDGNGNFVRYTRIQIQGVLDDLYTYNDKLGVVYNGNTITLRLWAPTAQSVELNLFSDATTTSSSKTQKAQMSFDQNTGVWSASSTVNDWQYLYYTYSVTVFVPSVDDIVTNVVTDPYSVSLSRDSLRSQIIDIENDSSFKPSGWDSFKKQPLESPLEIVVYELHVRDFSVFDESVDEYERGTYSAFDYNGVSGRSISNGMKHLLDLYKAGLTHIHFLPSFDISTIPENRNDRTDPSVEELESYGPSSETQQEIIEESRWVDSYNWGYDPYHFGVPEGSYAIPEEQNGGARILRYRTLIQRLGEVGLRVIQDVVYNHVTDYGQAARSVIDKIIPGYYLRLDNNGVIYQQTCCPDLATEFTMVEKLMIDHLVHWAKIFKMDGFRFDLMGFHTVDNMKNIRAALDKLTLENDGVSGKDLYIYGEGWAFGSAQAKGFSTATQWGVAGLGIGTFNDKIRDAVHGGSKEDTLEIRTQGFINGLSYDWNGYYYNGRYQSDLRYKTDVIRVGMAGNLQNYQFVDQDGKTRTGAEFGVGYTLSPRECINYAASHDDQSLFDLSVFKAHNSTSQANRARIQNIALSIISLSQGIPFFDAGVDMLRSKSLDRNTYDSGDWFNGLDFTYNKNNYAIGMPPKWGNEHRYSIIRPLLELTTVAPTQNDIVSSVEHLKEMIQIRKSSKLFRLTSESDIKARVKFHNTGPSQADALIIMEILDNGNGLPQIDPTYQKILVVVNADKSEKRYTISSLIGNAFTLHPTQQSSHDSLVKNSSFNSGNGQIYVPQRTTAVFVLNR